MALTSDQKLDVVWKKVVYGTTDTAISPVKEGPNESISSDTVVYPRSVWTDADNTNIPGTPPSSTTQFVKLYLASSRIQMVADPTVSGKSAWIAVSAFTGNPTNDLQNTLNNFVSPTFGSGYLIKVYATDPTIGSPTPLNSLSTGFEWIFDYSAGVLIFPNTVPAGVITSGTLFITCYQYVGRFGIQVNGNKISFTVSGQSSPVSNGNFIISDFFTSAPVTSTESIFLNGIEIESYTINNTDLQIDVDTLGYDIENGDVITSRFLS